MTSGYERSSTTVRRRGPLLTPSGVEDAAAADEVAAPEAGAEVADFLGRRWAIITESILFSVGILVQMTAFTVWQQVAVGRFIAGMGVGALSAVVPMVRRVIVKGLALS